MKKIQTDNENVEMPEDEAPLQPFFFSNEGRTIMAHSVSEARRLLALEQGQPEQ